MAQNFRHDYFHSLPPRSLHPGVKFWACGGGCALGTGAAAGRRSSFRRIRPPVVRHRQRQGDSAGLTVDSKMKSKTQLKDTGKS